MGNNCVSESFEKQCIFVCMAVDDESDRGRNYGADGMHHMYVIHVF